MTESELLEEIKKRKVLKSDKELAQFLGLNITTVWRIKTGSRGIGGNVYRAILDKCPEVLVK